MFLWYFSIFCIFILFKANLASSKLMISDWWKAIFLIIRQFLHCKSFINQISQISLQQKAKKLTRICTIKATRFKGFYMKSSLLLCFSLHIYSIVVHSSYHLFHDTLSTAFCSVSHQFRTNVVCFRPILVAPLKYKNFNIKIYILSCKCLKKNKQGSVSFTCTVPVQDI